MITTSNLPANYKPYMNLNFCSNNISGGGHIFTIGEVLPLLVGVGKTPRIWLQAVAAPRESEFITIVADSKSNHPAVEVKKTGCSILVYVHGKIVLSVKSVSSEMAQVSEVDFRPLGLNLFGNSSSLNLGGMHLSRNTFSNVRVAFKLGK
ncbi:hypothetical protein [Chitinibacter sp. ZOR0017]|uniref:hypothetical protein n=1 Tax=Chitinibacter sp. ZOR0017 TaxID=1339254 RepID=UPI00064613E5|nr:hypothetical protein [Chitinibacter sp. ZOR0017]